MDVGAFCKFIVGLGSKEFELILEDCRRLVEAMSQITLSPGITAMMTRFVDVGCVDNPRVCDVCILTVKLQPHSLFPQRTFHNPDPFKDDSYLWQGRFRSSPCLQISTDDLAQFDDDE